MIYKLEMKFKKTIVCCSRASGNLNYWLDWPSRKNYC